jgi:hypothetical protein
MGGQLFEISHRFSKLIEAECLVSIGKSFISDGMDLDHETICSCLRMPVPWLQSTMIDKCDFLKHRLIKELSL